MMLFADPQPGAVRSGWEQPPEMKAACHPDRERDAREAARKVQPQQETSIRIGYGDGVVQHGAKHSLQRKPGMEERSRFEQKIEFVEPAGRSFAAGYALDATQQIGNRRIEQRRPENQLVEIFDAETDHIVIFQDAASDFFTVYKYPVALAAIFDVVTALLQNERGTLAGNAGVLDLEVFRRVAGAAD